MGTEENNEITIKQIIAKEKNYVKAFSVKDLETRIMSTSEIDAVNDRNKALIHKNTNAKNLPEEVWKAYSTPDKLLNKKDDGKNVEVSNKGRVKIDGTIRQQNDCDKKGYLVVDGCKTGKYVYQVVAETWLEKDDAYEKCEAWEVHHITNNGYDNSTENLIYIPSCIHKKITIKLS